MFSQTKNSGTGVPNRQIVVKHLLFTTTMFTTTMVQEGKLDSIARWRTVICSGIRMAWNNAELVDLTSFAYTND